MAFVVCIRVGVSELLPTANGRVFSPTMKVISRVQRRKRDYYGKDNYRTNVYVTNNCHLGSWGLETRSLSRITDTNLDLERRLCLYFGVSITVAGIERRYIDNRQPEQASAETRGNCTRCSTSVWGASAEETVHPSVGTSLPRRATLLDKRCGRWRSSV